MKTTTFSIREVQDRLEKRLLAVQSYVNRKANERIVAYGIPRGGVSAVLAMGGKVAITENPLLADIFVDDIIDSRATRDRYQKEFPHTPFIAAVDKTTREDESLGWVVFPWERTVNGEAGETAEDNIVRLLQALGEDPRREGLIETPKRYVKAMRELTQGYTSDPRDHLLKSFPINDAGEGVSTYDALIISKDLPFVSLCEHHLLPFDGVAHLAYIPSTGVGSRIVGLSKLARLLDGYSQRLQVQERLTRQIGDAMNDVLKPTGAAVIISGRHTCQCFRGVKKPGNMVTSALYGVFKTDPQARQELMSLIAL